MRSLFCFIGSFRRVRNKLDFFNSSIGHQQTSGFMAKLLLGSLSSFWLCKFVFFCKIEGLIILKEDTPREEFIYFPSDDQYNIIEVDGTRIRDKEDNSPDQIAVKTGWISRVGQTSICLPHGLMIEIVSTQDPTEETDTIIPL